MSASHGLDTGHDGEARRCGLTVRRRGSVKQANFTVAVVATDPLRRGRAGDPHFCGNVGDQSGLTVLNEATAPFGAQGSVRGLAKVPFLGPTELWGAYRYCAWP